jgi:primosomal protein N' (replication factor Y)
MTYARVAVNVPALSGEFDYSLPSEVAAQIQVGSLVVVPFGNQTVQGVVTQILEQPSVAQTKPISALLDARPVLTIAQIELAKWMSGYFLQPLAAFIGLMLPAGLSQQADTQYSVVSKQLSLGDEGEVQKRLLRLLQERGSLRGRQIDRHFGRVDWRKSMQVLVKRGRVTSQPVLPPPSVRPKFVRTAQLAVSPEQAEAAIPTVGKTAETLRRRGAALRCLIRQPQAVNVAWVYAESGCNLADLQELAERELITLQETEIWRDPLDRIESRETENAPPVKLTPDQQAAWQEITEAFSSTTTPQPFLLHGVTGSGKTEIYIRAAEETVRRGRQALILVPEIALTPQTVHRFLVRFPGQVGLVHSKLSDGERYDTWRRARAGLLKVIIGPRSALFTPLPNIGLIVLDECHDASYYQSEPPFYHAVTAAQHYARLCGAVCLLGSATPPIAYRYQAERGKMRLLGLPQRIRNGQTEASDTGLPPVHIVDMRDELKSGHRGIFSRRLLEALAETLARGEQAILFLNRRGTATYVFCRECGHVLKCPQCEMPLTQHVEEPGSGVPSISDLRCHRCGYHRQMPKKCPICGGTQIRAYGLGSEKVEREVQALFPSARTLRWDWETTRHKDAHEIILSHFAAGRADVLVGTQMLAKGLDLP